MSLNDKPAAERVHIGFFGLRNAGKSSLVNAVTGQNLALVSDIKGTTTDPVLKTMELLPIGPVVIIDTPGIDDEGELGSMRVERAEKAGMKKTIRALREAEESDQWHIIVGGAPVNGRFAREHNAEYAADAVETVNLALKACGIDPLPDEEL